MNMNIFYYYYNYNYENRTIKGRIEGVFYY